MFSVRIRSLETSPSELAGKAAGDAKQGLSSSRNPGPCILVFYGVLHLYHDSPPPSSSSSPSSSTPRQPHPSSILNFPARRGTHLLILAVPSRLTLDDFRRFCGKYIKRAISIGVIRNEEIEDRYSVLVEFDDQKTADAFYRGVNGWRFTNEGEICHVLFIGSVENIDSTETDGTAPAGLTELPTCPVCIERLDQEITGLSATNCDNSFRSPCISKWVNSSCTVCQFYQNHFDIPACSICGTSENLWICVICGFVGCGRYREGHARRHRKDTQHSYFLDLETPWIQDYFGRRCSDESGTAEDLLRSKIEVAKDEYNRLLASQLESQKQYYDTLIQEKMDKKGQYISEAVKKAINLKMRDIQLQINEINREIKTITAINKKLEKEQNFWQKKIEEVVMRVSETLEMMDEEIEDTQEEIMDYIIFIGSRKKLGMDVELPKSASPPSSVDADRSSRRSRSRRR